MVNIELKKARLEQKLTQKEFSKLLGMNVATYCRKENGIREFRESEMLKVAELLNKSPEEIFFNKKVTK